MINEIIKIAEEAGKIVKKGYVSPKDVKYKGISDLVTEYDIATEAILKEKLTKHFPDYKIIAEESSENPQSPQGKAIYIDPIDGTTNFVHGLPSIAISIGVYDGTEGQYALVYNPIMNEVYSAVKGEGAYFNGKKICVSRTVSMEKSLIATGFPYTKDNLPWLIKVLEETITETRGIRRLGSAALDLCYVARGIFDLYYESKLKTWDYAAGIMIVREAGGLVTNMKGLHHELNHDTVIASNGLIHKEFMNMLNEIK